MKKKYCLGPVSSSQGQGEVGHGEGAEPGQERESEDSDSEFSDDSTSTSCSLCPSAGAAEDVYDDPDAFELPKNYLLSPPH
jgi:hypothetical protein